MGLTSGIALVCRCTRQLAWSGDAEATWLDLAKWTAVLLSAILLLTLLVYVVRSWVRTKDADMGPVFTLQDLRGLRERGELTEAEFDRLRAQVLADVRESIGQSTGVGESKKR